MSEMSTFVPDSNLLIVVGYSDVPDTDSLANALSQHLRIPVWSAFLEGYPSVGEGIREGVITYRPNRIIVLPLFLGATEAQKNNIYAIVDAARDRWSDVEIIYGKPLAHHAEVVAAYHQLLTETTPSLTDDTALLVVAGGSRDAESNAEVYHMARLLYERVAFVSLDVAFYRTTTPDIAAGVKRCVQSGARRIIVVPYLLYEKTLYEAIYAEVQQIQTQYSDVEILTAPHLNVQTGILEAISQRYDAALKSLDLPPDEETIRRRTHTHVHGTKNTHTHTISSNLLPPRYQEGAIVSAAPMGAADLIYDEKGQVAWVEIWGGFCDLALAGGPPHRGTLLEPVSPESVRANPERYQQVLAELERGIVMVTQLPIVISKSLGWIGIQCASEEMALWLLRAIVVENISIRREDAVLYLPAGPDFRLEHEIKNVITVVAKTHHYWTEHITSQPKSEISTS
jgi:sirohydrochlorin cobaltochelatase